MMPIAIDSPMTWKTTRRLFQPSAFRMPNSRMRRVTAAKVSRLASRNAGGAGGPRRAGTSPERGRRATDHAADGI